MFENIFLEEGTFLTQLHLKNKWMSLANLKTIAKETELNYYCIWYVILILEMYSSSSSNIHKIFLLEKWTFLTQYLTFESLSLANLNKNIRIKWSNVTLLYLITGTARNSTMYLFCA